MDARIMAAACRRGLANGRVWMYIVANKAGCTNVFIRVMSRYKSDSRKCELNLFVSENAFC